MKKSGMEDLGGIPRGRSEAKRPSAVALLPPGVGFAALSLVCASAAWSQTQVDSALALGPTQGASVHGRVQTTQGEPVEGATVEIPGTGLSTLTNASGDYGIEAVPVGTYAVRVTAAKLTPQTRTLSFSDGQTWTVGFTLYPDLLGSETIVITTRIPERKISASMAITTLDDKQIEARAPRSTADLMTIVPGFYVEASGGEVGNNVFVRGLPADGSYRYVAVMEDGMPVYDSTELFFVNSDIFVRVDENVDRLEAIRGGSSALFGSNAPGGVINFISKEGGPTLRGTIKTALATGGLFRYDANVNGPVGDDWRFSVGGLYRFDNGIRHPGFPGSHGGLLRGSVTRLLDKGQVRVVAKYLNDRNVFYLPVPLRGQFNARGELTGTELVAGFPANGTMTSREGVDVKVPLPRDNGDLVLPLDDGQRQVGGMVMAELRLELPDGWYLQNNTRAMKVDHSWNAILPFELRDADTWAKSVLGDTAAYRITCTNLPGDPELGSAACPTANNLVSLSGQWLVKKPLSNVSSQFKLTKFAPLRGAAHSFTGGFYLGHYTADNTWYFNQIITDVRSNPHFLDLHVIDAGGNLQSITRDGFRRYLDNYVSGTSNATLGAAFLGDEINVANKVRVNLGARVEHNAFQQNVEDTVKLVTLSDPDSVARSGECAPDNIPAAATPDTCVTAGTGAFRRVDADFADWAVSLGVNYMLREGTALYARGSRGYRMPMLDQYLFATDRNDESFPDTAESLWQLEAGVKAAAAWLALSAVAYGLQIRDFPSQDVRVDPATGEPRWIAAYVGEARTLGVETELAAQPSKYLHLRGMVTAQDPTYSKFFAQRADRSGNRIRRIPQILTDVMATGMLGAVTLAANHTYVGHRYANASNTIDLPGFHIVNVRASYEHQEGFTVSLGVHNLLDGRGLTESNPRTDESREALADIFLARPVLPRRATLTLAARF